ncbi:MAG: hypothetical protein DBY37_04230 [Desulfovibrionaceae bacterium]|nr:MAG: hypothetical protein DBY37_04230 [Desulfovibrionaceae bacterium]
MMIRSAGRQGKPGEAAASAPEPRFRRSGHNVGYSIFNVMRHQNFCFEDIPRSGGGSPQGMRERQDRR